jgi:hypothetical protein
MNGAMPIVRRMRLAHLLEDDPFLLQPGYVRAADRGQRPV